MGFEPRPSDPQSNALTTALRGPMSCSFLKDKKQVATVSDVKSSPSLMTYGVPQGSNIAPILFILNTKPLSDVIWHDSVCHHMFADVTELYKSDPPTEAFTPARTMESCISDVKVWVVQNEVKLTDDKTEILMTGSALESPVVTSCG